MVGHNKTSANYLSTEINLLTHSEGTCPFSYFDIWITVVTQLALKIKTFKANLFISCVCKLSFSGSCAELAEVIQHLFCSAVQHISNLSNLKMLDCLHFNMFFLICANSSLIKVYATVINIYVLSRWHLFIVHWL